MFSHVMLGSDDIEVSKKFYDAILKELGYEAGIIDPKGRCFYRNDADVFGLTKPINGESASHGNGMTIGFKATSTEMIDAWHAAGVANGGTTCEDLPGIREVGGRQIYLAYLRDPFGNKLSTVYVVNAG